MRKTNTLQLIGIVLAAMFLITVGVGISLITFYPAKASDTDIAEVTGIQVRSDGAWSNPESHRRYRWRE